MDLMGADKSTESLLQLKYLINLAFANSFESSAGEVK